MDISASLLLELFGRSLALWYVILPGMILGTIVGILPGFSAQNTLIILLPLTLYMGHRGRHGLDDFALLHDPARRRNSRHPVQHAGRRRRRRDHARRLSDDQEGPGAAGAGLLLCRVRVRRSHHYHHHDAHAAGARSARSLLPQRRDGRGDGVRPDPDRRDRRARPAQGADRRFRRPDDRRHRRRSRCSARRAQRSASSSSTTACR